jgi:superfamily II DNA/RNA helicase
MYEWMGKWAVALRSPSDIGYPDDGYQLPELRIHPEVVAVDIDPGDQLFATDLGGVGGRAKVRRETLTARVDVTVDLVNSTDDQWIVWCGLNDEASKVAARTAGAVNVAGSMTPDEKASALEAFQDGAIRVLVTKPAIAGFGMNFQNAHRMVFVGLSDSYEAYYQAIRRCYRFGQTEPVDVHIVVSELERQIVDNVRRKEAEAAGTTAGLVKYSPLRKDHDGIESAERDAAAVRGGRRPRRMLASTTRR